jgi:hypothetical protein
MPAGVLIDVMVAAVPGFPTFPFEPGGDLAPVRFEDRSRSAAALSRHT